MNPYGKRSLIAEKFTAQAAIIEFSILSYPLEYWFCKLKTTKTKQISKIVSNDYKKKCILETLRLKDSNLLENSNTKFPPYVSSSSNFYFCWPQFENQESSPNT